MAIVKMNKFILFAFDGQKDLLLNELQKTEAVHFKNLQTAELREMRELAKVSYMENLSLTEIELSKINFVLSKIEPYCKKPKGLKSLTAASPNLDFDEFYAFAEKFDYNALYNITKDNDERQKLLKNEKNRLNADNNAVAGWIKLDTSIDEISSLKSIRYMLGTLPKKFAEFFVETVSYEFSDIYIEILDAIKEETGILVVKLPEDFDEISNLAKSYGFTKAAPVPNRTPKDIIAANNSRISEIEIEVERLENEIKARSSNSNYEKLKISRDYFKTISEKCRVCENFLKTQNVFIAGGWVAQTDTGIFEDAVIKACGNDYFLESAPAEKDSEDVPVRLKNNKLVSAFESITEMYSMPKYNGVDPTPLLTPFYLLFFAMMLGDAGYGLVLTVASAFSLGYFNLKQGTRRFFKFFLYLGIATMIMGILYGSLFGVTFFTPLNGKPVLDLTGDIMLMLILSMAIGFVQIIFGLCVKGYMLLRDGKILDAVFDVLFWILAVGSLAGLLAFNALGTDSAATTICGWTLAGSLAGLACTQGRSSMSLGGKIGNGIYSVYNITGYIGDLVSYTRLMAIALAGAYIAFSFNLMGGLLIGNENPGPLPVSVLKYIFAALIVVFGAALNMGLGALGGYVHACRLQYVEYFGKFYEGGGVPFKPFGLKNTFVNITKINRR